MFLHGSGKRGENPELVKKNGSQKLVEEGNNYPFVIVSPQCPQGQWWSTNVLNLLLDKIIKKYPIDKERIYFTGLSMGGFGARELALKHLEHFAAITPVCGGGDTINIKNLKNVPVGAFHGKKDNVVPMQRSIDMVNALNHNGGNAKLTLYPEASHDFWTETYNDPALYEWFLQHRRKLTALKSNQ